MGSLYDGAIETPKAPVPFDLIETIKEVAVSSTFGGLAAWVAGEVKSRGAKRHDAGHAALLAATALENYGFELLNAIEPIGHAMGQTTMFNNAMGGVELPAFEFPKSIKWTALKPAEVSNIKGMQEAYTAALDFVSEEFDTPKDYGWALYTKIAELGLRAQTMSEEIRETHRLPSPVRSLARDAHQIFFGLGQKAAERERSQRLRDADRHRKLADALKPKNDAGTLPFKPTQI